jgi:putative thioredoxin
MMDATVENFEAEVMTASMTTPVLVDFWAPWCGPCKTLGPILEKLEIEYAGRFKLVKIDSDQEQQIAQAFGIRSIPTCVLIHNGQPVDGFTGAQPEGKLREFLDKHLPPAPVLDDAELALEALPEPGSAEALAALEDAVKQAPDNDEARLALLQALLLAGSDDAAKVALAPVMARVSTHRRFEGVQRILNAMDFAAAYATKSSAIAEFNGKLLTNKRDFDAYFSLAQLHIGQRQWTQAMDALLEILMRDKTWAEDKARKTYVAILETIEPPKVKVADGQIPPQDPTVATYRRRLSSVVLS